jgi:hypothetical protein
MTKFGRSGHYRTNQNGTTFWVSDHSVSRDDWPSGVPRAVMRAYGHVDAVSPSRNVTIPNARCPECHQPVFFFMATNGGRVFFDDLGPPWPKHPCTISVDARVPGFADAGSIVRWQQERRRQPGLSISDEALALRPGCVRGTARMVRRRGKTIAAIETDEGAVAFEVVDAWSGRSSKTVYFRQTEPPEMPESLEYLGTGLEVVSMRVVAAVEVPTEPSTDDFPALAETALDEVELWMRAHLPAFRLGPRLKLDGHKVGIAGRIGRSRAVLLPLAAYFDADEDEWAREDSERVKSAEQQVHEWTGRITRMLDRSDQTRKDPLFRDVFVWVAPESSWTFEIERAVRTYALGNRLRPAKGGSLGLPPAHAVQTIGSDIEEEVRETRFGLQDLTPGERSYLAEGFKQRVEKRWLAAMLRDAGLDPVFELLGSEGVLFEFMGTMISEPMRWGQQALLPDGRRLLVLLHLSSEVLGLAFVHFGAPTEDDYGDKIYQADAIFHAKRLAAIYRFLETGSADA